MHNTKQLLTSPFHTKMSDIVISDDLIVVDDAQHSSSLDDWDSWHIEKEVVHPFNLEIVCENWNSGNIYINTYALEKVKVTKNGNLKFLFVPTLFEGGYVEGPRWVKLEDFTCEMFEKTNRLREAIKRLARIYKTQEQTFKRDDDFELATTSARSMKNIVHCIWQNIFEPLSFFNLDYIDFSEQ